MDIKKAIDEMTDEELEEYMKKQEAILGSVQLQGLVMNQGQGTFDPGMMGLQMVYGPPPGPQAPAAGMVNEQTGEWRCSCGELNTGKFCGNRGMPRSTNK